MQSGGEDIRPYLKALVLLGLEELLDREPNTKPELLLDRAGIDRKEIAEMLGKTYEAVTKTINRAKGGTAKERLQKSTSPTSETE